MLIDYRNFIRKSLRPLIDLITMWIENIDKAYRKLIYIKENLDDKEKAYKKLCKFENIIDF